MSHSVHPYSHRLGLIRDWQSRWFGVRGSYREFLKTDITIREFLNKKLQSLSVDRVEIERSPNAYRVVVKTSRPGLIIGRQGEGAIRLKDDILALVKKVRLSLPKEFKLDVEEVRYPESRASIVAQMVAEGLDKRMPFRRVLKQTAEKSMANKQVQGVKITISGRLGGTDIARTESIKHGRLPLQTLRADVDFARVTAVLPYGTIGVKVWIYRGEIFPGETEPENKI